MPAHLPRIMGNRGSTGISGLVASVCTLDGSVSDCKTLNHFLIRPKRAAVIVGFLGVIPPTKQAL
jgi:hypothetical protein